MKNLFQVFLGGMIGSLLRFIVQSLTSVSIMLWIVNVLGSFALGSLNGYFERKENKLKLLFTTGMLGAFTTFSTFSEYWFHQLQENRMVGILYGIVMTICCFVAAFIGYFLNRGMNKWNGS
ncbi:CrcB family protein [Lysinibacillus halotolerans]|uniref:fluoride efflux transporter FluC n=1 Tax=Ureibacillus sp. FSL E2-3493 TaxID=2921367 RepID=UPI00311A9180